MYTVETHRYGNTLCTTECADFTAALRSLRNQMLSYGGRGTDTRILNLDRLDYDNPQGLDPDEREREEEVKDEVYEILASRSFQAEEAGITAPDF